MIGCDSWRASVRCSCHVSKYTVLGAKPARAAAAIRGASSGLMSRTPCVQRQCSGSGEICSNVSRDSQINPGLLLGYRG